MHIEKNKLKHNVEHILIFYDILFYRIKMDEEYNRQYIYTFCTVLDNFLDEEMEWQATIQRELNRPQVSEMEDEVPSLVDDNAVLDQSLDEKLEWLATIQRELNRPEVSEMEDEIPSHVDDNAVLDQSLDEEREWLVTIQRELTRPQVSEMGYEVPSHVDENAVLDTYLEEEMECQDTIQRELNRPKVSEMGDEEPVDDHGELALRILMAEAEQLDKTLSAERVEGPYITSALAAECEQVDSKQSFTESDADILAKLTELKNLAELAELLVSQSHTETVSNENKDEPNLENNDHLTQMSTGMTLLEMDCNEMTESDSRQRSLSFLPCTERQAMFPPDPIHWPSPPRPVTPLRVQFEEVPHEMAGLGVQTRAMSKAEKANEAHGRKRKRSPSPESQRGSRRRRSRSQSPPPRQREPRRQPVEQQAATPPRPARHPVRRRLQPQPAPPRNPAQPPVRPRQPPPDPFIIQNMGTRMNMR